jgi:acyl carrier protein
MSQSSLFTDIAVQAHSLQQIQNEIQAQATTQLGLTASDLLEIRSAMRQHPAVQDAVALVWKDAQGIERLVAYLAAGLSQKEMRTFLREKLAWNLMPSIFVFLDELPRTPEGEIDCSALPSPDQANLHQDGGFVASRTPTEKKLAEIWAEFLELEQIGIHDDFFELGGDSVMALQILARVRANLQVELPLNVIFTGEFTVAEISKAIDQFQIERASDEDLAATLEQLEQLSDEQVRALLAGGGV